MTDVLTPAQRKKCMSRIRSKDTKPEMVVRRLAHKLGYRFRLHRRDLPGKPDLVFPSYHKVILVHGCFWHMHKCKYGKATPKTNSDFWQKKRRENVRRDRRNLRALKNSGWNVLVIWECQVKRESVTEGKLKSFLGKK